MVQDDNSQPIVSFEPLSGRNGSVVILLIGGDYHGEFVSHEAAEDQLKAIRSL